MGIVNSALHTVGVKRRKSASGDRYAREILYEENFVHVLERGGGGGKEEYKGMSYLKLQRKFKVESIVPAYQATKNEELML
jgi:hypothetical protein